METGFQFVWDSKKNKANLKKHGLDFETAHLVFLDPCRIKIFDDEHSQIEDRWIVLGIVGEVVLFVVITELSDTVINIISARKATRKEREIYNAENNIS